VSGTGRTVTQLPLWRAAPLWLFRKGLHRWYVRCQAEDPESYPIGEASPSGPDVWHDHVPGCGGSCYLNSRGDDFGNMINCRCHRLVAWLGLAVER
jgi:hypothetical protein